MADPITLSLAVVSPFVAVWRWLRGGKREPAPPDSWTPQSMMAAVLEGVREVRTITGEAQAEIALKDPTAGTQEDLQRYANALAVEAHWGAIATCVTVLQVSFKGTAKNVGPFRRRSEIVEGFFDLAPREEVYLDSLGHADETWAKVPLEEFRTAVETMATSSEVILDDVDVESEAVTRLWSFKGALEALVAILLMDPLDLEKLNMMRVTYFQVDWLENAHSSTSAKSRMPQASSEAE